MAGTFELFADEDSRIRFRLVAPDGTVLAVSGQYRDKYQAAAAIEDVRECAGTGLISDLVPAAGLARVGAPRGPHHVRPPIGGKIHSRGAA